MANLISRTDIEAFDYTWNPVYGCLTGCSYCWARQCVKRFAKTLAKAECKYLNVRTDADIKRITGCNLDDYIECKLRNFKPIFLESQFAKSFPKKPSRIVVGWMSDIAYWQPEWIERVLGKIREYPQHTFFFLTKKPETYVFHTFPPNCWLGVTITGQRVLGDIGKWKAKITGAMENKRFISFEPLLNEIHRDILAELDHQNWLIIGAQTGSGNKVIPKREWVEAIIKQARELRIPVYLKDNLLKAVPGLPNRKEIPE